MDYTKFLGEAGLAELWNLMTAYVDGKVWIGTREEYEASAENIAVGTMIVITNENDVVLPGVEDKTSTAILGTALLGTMILGKS